MEPTKKKTTITIEVDERAHAALELLARHCGGKSATDAVRHLVHSAADGVRRPGAWERGWLHRAFGSAWEGELEAYDRYYTRPRGTR